MEIVEIMSADYLQMGNFFLACDYIDDVFRLEVFLRNMINAALS